MFQPMDLRVEPGGPLAETLLEHTGILLPDTEERITSAGTTMEEKWNIIFQEQSRAPVYSVDHYIQYLRKFIKDGIEAPCENGKTKGDASPLSYLLRKLKSDLKSSYESFLREFINEKNKGINILLDLLKQIHNSGQKSTHGSRSRFSQYKKTVTDEYECLLCVKYVLRIKESCHILIEEPNGLETVGMCVMSSFVKSRITALETMTILLMVSKCCSRVMDVFTYLRLKFGESVRFKILVGMISGQTSSNVLFQIAGMQFFNSLLDAADNPNVKVYLQHEIALAGLDLDVLKKNAESEGLEFDDLRQEINEWQIKYLDVEKIMNQLGNNIQVTQSAELSHLKMQIEELKATIRLLEESKEKTQKELKECQIKLSSCRMSEDGSESESVTSPITRRIPMFPSAILNDIKNKEGQNGSHRYRNKESQTQTPEVHLPRLNWTPMLDVRNTVFQALDDECVLYDIDEEHFEEKFRVENRTKNLSFPNNIQVITQRRIGVDIDTLQSCIENYDTGRIDSDSAEMLLKYVPTKNEIESINTNGFEVSKLRDAEKLVYKLSQIERCDTRLRLIVFLGRYRETIERLTPQMDQIFEASTSVANSLKLRKLFEVVLAFGNRLNATRHNKVRGFRLQSLLKVVEVKSNDRSTNLLNYIAGLIEEKYPGIHEWFDDLQLDGRVTASFQAITSDVNFLKNGMKLLASEASYEQSNPRLQRCALSVPNDIAPILDDYMRMETAYRDVCMMFGENHRVIEPYEFFGYFDRFSRAYREAIKQNYQRKQNVPVRNQMYRRPPPCRLTQTIFSQRFSGSELPSPKSPQENQTSEFECNTWRSSTSSNLPVFSPSPVPEHSLSSRSGSSSDCDANWYIRKPSRYSFPDVDDDDNVCFNGVNSFRRTSTPSSARSKSTTDIDKVVSDIALSKSCDSGLVVCCSEDIDDNVLMTNIESEEAEAGSSNDEPTYAYIEPEPDYSTQLSPSGGVQNYQGEVAKVLSDFENTLKHYEGEENKKEGRYTITKSVLYI